MNANNMLNQIKTLLGMEVKFAQAKLENGTTIEAEEMSAGNEVFIVTEDEKIAMPVGEYQLEDGQILIVEEEGVIASIGSEEAPVEEEVEASEEVSELSEDSNEESEESQELSEELQDEEKYATKEELAEIKSMIDEIKAMLEPKEEMASQEEVELASQEPVEKITHNPETEAPKSFLYSQTRSSNTMDRVMQKIANIKK
jgi:hypothetical protein